jgi:hypothetical protein
VVAGRSTSPRRYDEEEGVGAEVAGSSTGGGSDRVGPAHGSPAPGCGERRQQFARPPVAGSPPTRGEGGR